MRLRLASSLALLTLLHSSLALANGDARLTYLTRQLKTAKDARVRAQSAVVLGQMDDAQVVPVLCEGLDDESEVVRTAVARALEEVGELEAIGCLKKHAADANGDAREAVTRALKALEAVKNQKPVVYVSLRPLKVKDVQLEAAHLELAEQKLKKNLSRMGAMLAPQDESKAAAKKVLKAKRIKGYLLMPELHGVGEDGLRIRILLLTYPEQTLLGEVDVKAAGGKPADLIRALAPRVVEEATEIFDL